MRKMRSHFIPVFLWLLVTSLLAVNGCDYVTGKAMGEPFQPQPQEPIIKDVSTTEAYSIITANHGNTNFVIIDVRTPEEYADGHISSAIIRDFKSPAFRDEIGKLDKNKTYLIYCRSGKRSASARDMMKELGFREVYNMDGGMIEWAAEGLPVVK